MNKSMYSLILTDEVVEKIDEMAYQQGMSRSQMIDHLLAREAGLYTPEQRTRMLVKETADRVSTVLPSLKLQIRSNWGSMEMATYVRYKYNPSVKYSFDIVTAGGQPVGCLRLSSRTTSTEVQTLLNQYLDTLSRIDAAGAKLFLIEPASSGRIFTRNVLLPRLFTNADDIEAAADHLSLCISLLEKTMQTYFRTLGDPDLQKTELISAYRTCIQGR
ncbi:MAG: ribbon-helix-helix protein, CopG family [Firmicutes bacterium]|nr:ribbon-helix-helix protein, CopG family [Bacillota bacterium]